MIVFCPVDISYIENETLGSPSERRGLLRRTQNFKPISLKTVYHSSVGIFYGLTTTKFVFLLFIIDAFITVLTPPPFPLSILDLRLFYFLEALNNLYIYYKIDRRNSTKEIVWRKPPSVSVLLQLFTKLETE